MKYREKLEKAIEKDLCDRCLGRLFAQLGTGTTNKERGKSIRIFYAMFFSDEERYEVPKESVPCELCGDIFNEIEKFAELATSRLQEYDFEDFLIGTRIDPEIEENEEDIWATININTGEPIKSEMNRAIGKLVESELEKEVNLEKPNIKAIIDTRFDSIEIEISPLFVYGRYKKLSRKIPQTKWICKRCRGKGCEKCDDTGKLYETSIEEIIGEPLMKMVEGTDFTLHGMGREDIDAKMLGNGRPFVMEIKEPKKREIDFEKLKKVVEKDNRAKILDLKKTKKDKVQEIKQAGADKRYKVEIELKEPVERAKFKKVVEELQERKISQRTPTRVDHRRGDKTRKRKTKGVDLIKFNKDQVVLELTCEAGTYVKELIHGDGGRTQPNLAELLNTKCDVKKLDVIEIKYPEGE